MERQGRGCATEGPAGCVQTQVCCAWRLRLPGPLILSDLPLQLDCESLGAETTPDVSLTV